MTVAHEGERRRFDVWMRTGRRMPAATAALVEMKYNHWHNPTNGWFTFAGSGRHDGGWLGGGFGSGGGGSMGGGGAQSDIVWPDKRPRPTRRMEPKVAVPVAARRNAIAIARSPKAAALRHVEKNGYHYQIDGSGRTRDVFGEIRMGGAGARSRRAQLQAGGTDRRRTDDGGHYIAVRFDGPTEAFNHFAQDAGFNRGRYRLLEDDWARIRRSGQRVFVDIKPVYDGTSKRPSSIEVRHGADGRFKRENFPNERRERRNAKR